MITIDPFKTVGKYNTSVKLTKEDAQAKVKNYCHEPYAQDLYNLMTEYDKTGKVFAKDLQESSVYQVRANTISFKDKMIYAEEVISQSPVLIPFREYSKDIDSLAEGNNTEFYIMVYKTTKHGENFGSEKRALSIAYKQELFDSFNQNQWFDFE